MTDDERVLTSLRNNGPGRAQDIRNDYKLMPVASINSSLHRLEGKGLVKQTKRDKKIFWEATPT